MAGGDLELVVWDVEHGVSILMNTPNGRTVMLDAGASDSRSPAEWFQREYPGQRLDAFILSHQHCDHVREIDKVWSLLKPRILVPNRGVQRQTIYGENDPPQQDPFSTFDRFDKAYNGPVPEDLKLTTPENWGGVRFRYFYNDPTRLQFDNVNNYSIAVVADFGSRCPTFTAMQAPACPSTTARRRPMSNARC